MEIEFVLERMHRRRFLVMRAYQIFFTDTHIYFIHLGEDSTQMPTGMAVGGLVGAIAQRVAENRTEKIIAKKLEELEGGDLDAVLAGDKRSFKATWAEVDNIESASMKWNRWPHVAFTLRGKGSFKFTFDLQMEGLEEERQAVVEYLRGKRPNLVKA